MTEEILVNVTPVETRVVVVDNGVAQDVHIERLGNLSIVGNIYSGKVVRVMPGMQAAFVDIGTQRNAFIHVSDLLFQSGEARGTKASSSDAIGQYLHDGQKILVQVAKESLGSKGARLTTELSVSSRYLVFIPQNSHVGVSQRIEDPAERARLQQLLSDAMELEEMPAQGGYILRTAAEGAGLDEVRADLRFLKRLWAAVSGRAKAARKPELLYSNLSLQMRTVRDLARPGVQRILVDSRESYGVLKDFCGDYVPEVAALLEHYQGECPLFDLYGIEDDLQQALGRKVALKSGGYLIIDQAEAMTTIDVNTGSFVGKRNLEETTVKTNLEAATALARQLRVRNLGGIIIIDFIDMREAEHRRQVHRTLEKALQLDPARTQIVGISELGLMQMTRKRTRESLEQLLCEDCPVCEGRGVLKTAETTCNEIFREIMRDAKAYENDMLMVLATQSVVDRLLDEESVTVANLEEFIGKRISFRAEPCSNPEHFDIVLL